MPQMACVLAFWTTHKFLYDIVQVVLSIGVILNIGTFLRIAVSSYDK